jgi:hypothetical protein
MSLSLPLCPCAWVIVGFKSPSSIIFLTDTHVLYTGAVIPIPFFAVSAAPTIVLEPESEVFVNPGASLTLTCVAHGVPVPDITWHSDEREISNDTSNAVVYHTSVEQSNNSGFSLSILELCPVTVADTGQYSCFANSSEGNTTIIFQVMVNQGEI